MKTVATFIALATLMSAQTPEGGPLIAFEVASVKPSTTTGSFSVNFPPGGRFSGRNLTVWNLMRMAYHLQDYQIQGAPAWADSSGYDIEARAAAGQGEPPREEMLKMIQALLAERFHLAMHRETRQLPVYDLVVGKVGPKLKPADSSASSDGTVRMGQLATQKMSMALLTSILAFDVKKPVNDKTGLKGDYAFTLEWTTGLGEEDAGQATRPSLFTAVQEQLGLKLESVKGPVEVVVIDMVEKPTEN